MTNSFLTVWRYANFGVRVFIVLALLFFLLVASVYAWIAWEKLSDWRWAHAHKRERRKAHAKRLSYYRSKLSTRGWGPWREEYYSICSAHITPEVGCRQCRCGLWHRVWRVRTSAFVFARWPNLWRWWMNREEIW